MGDSSELCCGVLVRCDVSGKEGYIFTLLCLCNEQRLRKKPPMKDFNFAFSEVPMNHIFEFQSKKIGDLSF